MANQEEKRIRKIRNVFLFGLTGVLYLAITGYVVMLLWNWVVPEISSLHVITYWQSLALVLLTRLLCRGFDIRKKYQQAVLGSSRSSVPPSPTE